jgi:hypothetical protein
MPQRLVPAPKNVVAPRTDRVGKLFLVLRGGLRRCIVCEDLFTSYGERSTRRCVGIQEIRVPQRLM